MLTILASIALALLIVLAVLLAVGVISATPPVIVLLTLAVVLLFLLLLPLILLLALILLPLTLILRPLESARSLLSSFTDYEAPAMVAWGLVAALAVITFSLLTARVIRKRRRKIAVAADTGSPN